MSKSPMEAYRPELVRNLSHAYSNASPSARTIELVREPDNTRLLWVSA